MTAASTPQTPTPQASPIPVRSAVAVADTWDLSSLFVSDSAWETGLQQFSEQIGSIDRFRGTLGDSAQALAACLDFMTEHAKLSERLGYYAHLRVSEDAGDSAAQDRFGRYMQAAVKSETAAGYQAPEIQAIADAVMAGYRASPCLAAHDIALSRLLRHKPHILSEPEERLLAMQEEPAQTAQKTFAALTDVDMSFGTVPTPAGEVPLSQSSLASLLQHADRSVRRTAYTQFMTVFEQHQHTLAGLYAGSVATDVFKARARRHPSVLASKLFTDDVDESVYRNLIDTVHSNLAPLHDYYRLRRRILGLDEMFLYDTKNPLVDSVTVTHSYHQAVELIVKALSPLGDEYTTTLRSGLQGRWVDRYENKGKRSGAFSAGSYFGNPFILMNYKSDVLRDVFTLAHEAGHSMHSWYSVRNNPFQHYQYTIFEAEVASTFNEQLLYKYLYDTTESTDLKTYLLNKQIDDIIGTLYRQTMFAEFELTCHEIVEAGGVLTTETLRKQYRRLLDVYFGGVVTIDDQADMEGLRIPHFYRAFYVYKYATGISASIELAKRVLDGGADELSAYFAFLKSGGSRFPLESLAVAGVDMSKPDAIAGAGALFASLVAELDRAFERR